MEARMKNPAVVIPEAMQPLLDVVKATRTAGVSESVLELVHLRASQINGCSFCVDGGVKNARKSGIADDKLFAVAAWREAPYFSDEERAALALTESTTRLADSSDPVPDAVWDAAADHFDERQLAAIILTIGVTNLFNRLNASTKQPAGAGW